MISETLKKKPSYILNESNLFEALFLVTVNCNAKCLFCCEQGKEEDESIDKMLAYVDPLVNILGVNIIDINGGEPLRRSNQDLIKLMQKINATGARTSISTNALSLTSEFLNQMKPYVDIVNVSLHGANVETHDYCMGIHGSYKKILKNIDLIINQGFDVHVSSVMLNNNITEADEMTKICSDLGVKTYCMNLLFGRGRGGKLLETKQPSKEDLIQVRDKLRQKYSSMNIYVNESHIGQCILVRPNGFLTGAPQNPRKKSDGLIDICNVLDSDLREKWDNYSFIQNHHKYNNEKFKPYLIK